LAKNLQKVSRANATKKFLKVSRANATTGFLSQKYFDQFNIFLEALLSASNQDSDDNNHHRNFD
jgi:hypothetical protein